MSRVGNLLKSSLVRVTESTRGRANVAAGSTVGAIFGRWGPLVGVGSNGKGSNDEEGQQ